MKKAKKSAGPIEGEGSYTGARDYDANLASWVKSGGVEGAANEAEKALDGPEGKSLREAEQLARSGPGRVKAAAEKARTARSK